MAKFLVSKLNFSYSIARNSINRDHLLPVTIETDLDISLDIEIIIKLVTKSINIKLVLKYVFKLDSKSISQIND